MRLRERELLRPPDRYGAGDWVGTKAAGRRGASKQDGEIQDELPSPPRIPPIARPTAGPPPFIDYNPNSPPAAFPTLDRPRPGNMPSSNNETNTPSGVDNEFQSERWSDMESSDEDDSGDGDDHSVDVEDYKYLHAPTHVEWKDLNPVIQMEIIQNLTQVYTWPRVVGMLQLSMLEQEDAFESPARRRKQAEEETQKLNDMQVKQLRALLRIDNSVLRKSRVPGQLVFRNISKQFLRATRNCTTVDHLMIKASELLAARRFLRRLGIDTKYAGEWKNDLATINQTPEDNGEDEFRWILDSDDIEIAHNQSAAQAEASSPLPSLQDTTTIGSNVRFINHFGDSGGNAYNVPIYEERSAPLPMTPLNAAQQIFGRRRSLKKSDRRSPNLPVSHGPESPIVRLSVGPEGAAQIQNIPTMSSLSPPSPQDIPSSPPVPLPSTSDQPPSPSLVSKETGSRKRRLSDSEIPSSRARDDDTLPVQRVLGGPWLYNSGPPSSQYGITSSKKLNERLHAARAESEIKRQTTSLAMDKPLRKTQFSLPIRNSPLMYNTRPSPPPCSDDTILQTPPPGYSDSTACFSTPTKKSNPHLDLKTSNKGAGTNMTSSSPEESERGPAYSPISPQMGTFPLIGIAGSVKGQGLKADPMDIDTQNPTDERDNKREAVSAAIKEGGLSASEQIPIPPLLPQKLNPPHQSSVVSSDPANEAVGENPILTMDPPKIKPENISKDDPCDVKTFSTVLHVCCDVPPSKPRSEQEERSPDTSYPTPTDSQNASTPKEEKELDETQAKKKLTKKKAAVPPKDRRRSTRLNGSAVRGALRPRAAPSAPNS
ncbi:hypothetical protein FQN49_006330 [Arthroderma sp. PD_2]|nr:hypothetical protein FQN49_006330 [Arthroderma sp. PD_2]